MAVNAMGRHPILIIIIITTIMLMYVDDNTISVDYFSSDPKSWQQFSDVTVSVVQLMIICHA